MSYPVPQVLSNRLGVKRIGWPGHPYYVEVSAYNPIYLSVRGEAHYRQLGPARRGYIASTERPWRMEMLMRKYLRIAWRLNHNPRFAKDTPAIVEDVLKGLIV